MTDLIHLESFRMETRIYVVGLIHKPEGFVCVCPVLFFCGGGLWQAAAGCVISVSRPGTEA